MSIYITKERKEELDSKIAKLKSERKYEYHSYIEIYEEILNQTIILPVEEDWEEINDLYIGVQKELYPNGVIIKK
jgi:hypothetical protein